MSILFPRDVPVLRSTGGRYVDGDWVESWSRISIKADVQSYTPTGTKQPPPGWQPGMGAVVIYTSLGVNLKAATNVDIENPANSSGDVVQWFGRYYRVVSAETKPYFLQHNKYMALEQTKLVIDESSVTPAPTTSESSQQEPVGGGSEGYGDSSSGTALPPSGGNSNG